MRILICDDDPAFTDHLEKTIVRYFRENRIPVPALVTYHDGDSLLADSGEKDLLFLDVEMPGPSGISVGNRIAGLSPRTLIIMITSYQEYLDDAMSFHVFRYLSKPLDNRRLYRNLKDALQAYHSVNDKIAIESSTGVFTAHTADIICIEAVSRKVFVHTPDCDYPTTQSMNYWRETLTQPCFFQTHRSFIINLSHVVEFNHDTIRLSHMENPAYLTRRRYHEFKERYLLYLASSR